MTYSVRREELAQLEPEWVQLLEQQPEPVPFQHPAWQRVWLEEFQDGRDLLLLSARDEVSELEWRPVAEFPYPDGRPHLRLIETGPPRKALPQ